MPIEKVGHFKDIDKLNWGGWHRAMGGAIPGPDEAPASIYYRYDDSQQDDFRWAYLDKLVKVGELRQVAALLINPLEITSDGEWESWLLSTQSGALRYRSFAEMMQTIAYREMLEVGGKSIPREDLIRTCAGHLKTAATLPPKDSIDPSIRSNPKGR
jgi:hypothetical protein